MSSTGEGYNNITTGRFEAAPDPDSDATDSDDNGTTFGNVVRSGPVTLALNMEPLDEPATPGLPDSTQDANANYTVDFGFFELPTALDEEAETAKGNFVFLPSLYR